MKRSDFRTGQRVCLTEYAKRAGIKLQRGVTTGVVQPKHGDESELTIRVLPDGYKREHSYYVDFWEPAGRRSR